MTESSRRGRDFPGRIFAEASPRSLGGEPLLQAARITADNVVAYRSDTQVIADAAQGLAEAGFEVLYVAPTTINIAGPAELYEEFFRTELATEERPTLKSGREETTATFIDAPATAQSGYVPTGDSPLAGLLEGVALSERVYPHVTAFPPTRAYWHLDVPGDVSLGVNADKAHRAGTTGLGVKVVMCDSGWEPHPFFEARGYRFSPTVAGPGVADAGVDESGHGTGESANVFAVAPDVDFTMVKMDFANPTGSFNAAVGLSPHVISCSWGWHVVNPPLSAIQSALAAAVATAVSSGIVVVCSAGNGGFSFPGQHPDVIAAGGVFLAPDGSIRATQYASGFASNVYPGRGVPDLSGLVGDLPKAISIMLPIPPGCEIDTGNAGLTHPDGDETPDDDGWGGFSGTSAAAPQLAGAVALIRQAAPALDPAGVRDVLRGSARDCTAGTNAQGTPAGAGYDLATGAGLLDAHRAVQTALTSVPADGPAHRARAAVG
jgi:Subtilase family